jgi:hypothetical protein
MSRQMTTLDTAVTAITGHEAVADGDNPCCKPFSVTATGRGELEKASDCQSNKR